MKRYNVLILPRKNLGGVKRCIELSGDKLRVERFRRAEVRRLLDNHIIDSIELKDRGNFG